MNTTLVSLADQYSWAVNTLARGEHPIHVRIHTVITELSFPPLANISEDLIEDLQGLRDKLKPENTVHASTEDLAVLVDDIVAMERRLRQLVWIETKS